MRLCLFLWHLHNDLPLAPLRNSFAWSIAWWNKRPNSIFGEFSLWKYMELLQQAYSHSCSQRQGQGFYIMPPPPRVFTTYSYPSFAIRLFIDIFSPRQLKKLLVPFLESSYTDAVIWFQVFSDEWHQRRMSAFALPVHRTFARCTTLGRIYINEL